MLSCIVEDPTYGIILLKTNVCESFMAIKFHFTLLDNAERAEKLSECLEVLFFAEALNI